MRVWWVEQIATDVPPDDEWLGAWETERLASFSVTKRRDDWRLGRWTAKHALAGWLSSTVPSFAEIEIRPALSGEPEAFCRSERLPVTISLSHRDGHAACAMSEAGVALGCDVEMIELRSDAFIADYFTDAEKSLIASVSEPFALVALLWSAKESALKALHEGLRLDTRDVSVVPGCLSHLADSDTVACATRWSPLHVKYEDMPLAGWWNRDGTLVRTLVANPAPAPPWCSTRSRGQ